MDNRVRFLGVILVLLFTAAYGCGGSDKGDEDKDNKDSGAQEEGGTSDSAVSGEEDAGQEQSIEEDSGSTNENKDAAPAANDDRPTAETCGNGAVEGKEECDDGNQDNSDSCNTRCRYSCYEDYECEDTNACNGKETCADHACTPGSIPADGTPCGSGKACWKEVCLENRCGDRIVLGDEQCDDGNLEANDGCTPACKWSCEKTEDCASYAGECTGAMGCNDHKCVASETIADKTDCSTGWCIKGQCVPKGCGDGQVDATEECDKGDENGKEGSGCTVACKIIKCSNGILEEGEECDDGNLHNLDGCNSNCKIELAHRWTMFHLVQTDVPDFCVYQSNRYGDAYASGEQTINITLIGRSFTINVLQSANDGMDAQIYGGGANTIVHLFDSSDTSMQTSDPTVQIGIYDAIPAKEWVEGPPLDFPFLVLPTSLDKNHLPLYPITAEQAGGGKVVSKTPFHIVSKGPTGRFEIYDAMLRYTYDVSKLSPPTPHNKFPFSNDVSLPETLGTGAGDPAAADYNPSGMMCGAIPVATLQARPIDGSLAELCCKPDNTKYRACENGKTPPDCDSYADILKNGCVSVCPDSFNLATMTVQCQAGCGVTIITPIDPDVDANKDGTNDAYSAVYAFEAKRVRIAGIGEE